MFRVLLVSFGALALVIGGADAFLVPSPSTSVHKAVASPVRSPVAPLEMAKHPEFKIVKKKMHKRPKKKGADARRKPPVYELHEMDTSGRGWFLPEEQGWVPYDPKVHGEIPADAIDGRKVVMVRPADWK